MDGEVSPGTIGRGGRKTALGWALRPTSDRDIVGGFPIVVVDLRQAGTSAPAARARPSARRWHRPRAWRQGRGSAGSRSRSTRRPASARPAGHCPGVCPTAGPDGGGPEAARPTRPEDQVEIERTVGMIDLVGDQRHRPSARWRRAGTGTGPRHRPSPVTQHQARNSRPPGDPDIGQPTFLLETALIVERSAVREDPLLEAGDEHDPELQALGGVRVIRVTASASPSYESWSATRAVSSRSRSRASSGERSMIAGGYGTQRLEQVVAQPSSPPRSRRPASPRGSPTVRGPHRPASGRGRTPTRPRIARTTLRRCRPARSGPRGDPVVRPPRPRPRGRPRTCPARRPRRRRRPAPPRPRSASMVFSPIPGPLTIRSYATESVSLRRDPQVGQGIADLRRW